jgi:hypothetical protein
VIATATAVDLDFRASTGDIPDFGCDGDNTSARQARDYFDFYLPRRLGVAEFRAVRVAWRAFLRSGNANGRVSHQQVVSRQASVVHRAVIHNPVLQQSHLWEDWRQPMFMQFVRPEYEIRTLPGFEGYIFP